MSKTFNHIPKNVDVMLDANVVVYALFPQAKYHNVCKQLLERGAKGEINLHLVVNTAADVIHRDLHTSKQYREEYGLMVNDSLIVAVMKREKIQHLATNDTDFERIPDIAVRVPN
jgi:predicted nucleic acid-binding protein